jgi:serine protease Do
MKITQTIKYCAILLGLSMLAPAQRGKDEVPLMRPDEKKAVDAQTFGFNKALEIAVKDASQSTLLIWGRDKKPRELAYGTVVADGTQVLTKWSEIERYVDTLYVQNGSGEAAKAVVSGVFTDEDLVLLDIQGESFAPAKFYESPLPLGRFLAASRPNGKPGAFGVVAVLERNLREADRAHLGIMADSKYRGEGVRIANVQPEFGAAEAGLQAGDVILKIDDRTISGLQELRNALSGKQPGDKVVVEIESAGKQQIFEVMLSNRPVFGQFSGGRLNQMERMGGDTNGVSDGFSRVVQTDMQIKANHVGGPVVDLQGRIVGVTMARADRTRTYIMGSSAVVDVLKGDADTVAEARTKIELRKKEMVKQRLALLPKARSQGKARDPRRMRRHLSDMERLIERMDREMEALGER